MPGRIFQMSRNEPHPVAFGERVTCCRTIAASAARLSKPTRPRRSGRSSGSKLRSIVWDVRSMDDPSCVTALLNDAGETVTGWSTVGRKLAFANGHTIHQALIAVLIALSGRAVPDRLGFAPSTPRKAV
jgi:hypothetical protein